MKKKFFTTLLFLLLLSGFSNAQMFNIRLPLDYQIEKSTFIDSITIYDHIYLVSDGDTLILNPATLLTLFDLRVGGSSKFSVDSSGNVTIAGTMTNTGLATFDNVVIDSADVDSADIEWASIAKLTDGTATLTSGSWSALVNVTATNDLTADSLISSTGNRFTGATKHGQALFTVNDATPSVTSYEYFKTRNTSTTAITDFDGDTGTNSMIRVLHVWINDAYTSISHDASKIKLAGGINLKLTTGDRVGFIWDNSSEVWCESYRKIY